MTDKVNDQYIRAEVFKRDVEDRQLAVQRNQRELELLKVSQAQAYHSQGAGQTLVAGRAEQAQRRSIRDIQPLKTKAFMFDKSGIGPRQLSAHDVYGNEANLETTSDALQRTMGRSDAIRRPAPFSVARQQAMLGSSSNQTFLGQKSRAKPSAE